MICARSTLRAVESERDRLREQNDKLIDAVIRLERKREGLSELPPQPRKPAPELTPAIMERLESFEGEARNALIRSARLALAKGKPEREILRQLDDAIGGDP